LFSGFWGEEAVRFADVVCGELRIWRQSLARAADRAPHRPALVGLAIGMLVHRIPIHGIYSVNIGVFGTKEFNVIIDETVRVG
jgi:hypothetical protein